MLQALVDKLHPYSHKWSTRRVVFEPTHRYLLYSAELSDDHAKREAVQEAIVECRDIENAWKHKMKVTSITRDAQEHRRSPEHLLREDFSVRELLQVRVEGYRRAVGSYDRFASATHATFDESSPMVKRPKQASDVLEAPKPAVIISGDRTHKNSGTSRGATPPGDNDTALGGGTAEVDSLNAGQTKEVWSFRFFSEAVFWQWYTTIVSTLERDHLLPRLDRFALTKDPRNGLPLPKLPLHLLSSFSILEPVVTYLILKGTRVFLDHAAAREAARHGAGHAIHLTHYQESAGISMPTYLVFTDVSAVFAQYDGSVAAVIAYRDLSEVWFHDTSSEDSFLLFRFRDGLTADFLFVASSGGDTNAETNALYSGAAWRDPTQMGRDGILAAIHILRALQPMIADQRQHLLDALKTIPAFKGRLDEFSYLEQGALQKEFPLLGMNIYADFKEFVLAEHDHIRWENGSLEARKAVRFPKKTIAVTKKIELAAVPSAHVTSAPPPSSSSSPSVVVSVATKGPQLSTEAHSSVAAIGHRPQLLDRVPELPTKKSSNLRELVMSPMRKVSREGPAAPMPGAAEEAPIPPPSGKATVGISSSTEAPSPDRTHVRPAIDLDTLFSPFIQKKKQPADPPSTAAHDDQENFEIDDNDL